MASTSSTPVSLVTGGAGFLGSHLCERLLAEGHRVIAMDNLITGSTDNIAHLSSNKNFSFIKHNVTQYISLDGPVDYRVSLRLARQPHRLPGTAHPDAQGRLARHAQRARPGQGQKRALPPRFHFGMSTATRWSIRRRRNTGATSIPSARAACTTRPSVSPRR